MMKSALRRTGLWAMTALAAACSSGSGTNEVQSSQQRITTPNVPADQVAAAAQSERDFGIALYGQIVKNGGNAFISPHSIAEALTMLYAGAAGTTQSAMRTSLQLTLPDSEIHAAMNALDLQLESRGQGQAGTNGQPFSLKVANGIWSQEGFDILPSYLDTIALNYGAGVQLVDFVKAPVAAVNTINTWVEKQTNDKIQNLLGPNSVNDLTRLVLTNAVYFDASWASPFNASATSNQSFTRADGSVVSTATMKGTATYGSYQGNGVTAVSLPYAGDQLSMLIIEPDDLASFEASLSGAVFDGIVAGLKQGNVILSLPKWKLTIPTDLKAPLSAIGMSTIFDPSTADFSGIDGQRDLVVQDVVHKAYIDVDEAGTEAAAATAIIVGTDGVAEPMNVITIDHPFVFAIRDEATGAVVFLGRVIDPTAAQ